MRFPLRMAADRWLVLMFFMVLAAVGGKAAWNMPMAMDEPIMNTFGREAVGYVEGLNPWPRTNESRFHGPLVEMLIFKTGEMYFVARYKWAGVISTPADLTRVRHTVTFLLFIAGVFAIYLVGMQHFRNRTWALLCCTVLVLSPRILGEAFTNSRDIPFMSFFTWGMWSLGHFLKKRNMRWAVVHAILCAAAMATRSMGILLPAMTIMVLAVHGYRRSMSPRQILVTGGVHGMVLVLCTVLFWPLLWEAPLKNFADAISFAGDFQGGGLLLGTAYSPAPWFYTPVWIVVTTPLVYLMLSIVGLWKLLTQRGLHAWTVVLWLAIPLLMVMMKSGTYNGWRHLYFVYPAIVVLTVYGLRDVWTALRSFAYGQWVLCGSLSVHMLLLAVRSWQAHPVGYVYFNLPATWIQGNFELDYWALGSNQALTHVVQNDERPSLRLYVSNNITMMNAKMFFPQKQWEQVLDPLEADYVIDTSNTQPVPSQNAYTLYARRLRVGSVRRMP